MSTIVINVGLVYMTVCSDDTDLFEILRVANMHHPTGLEHGWMLSPDETFSGGEPNPCPCDRYPTTHTHYLLSC